MMKKLARIVEEGSLDELEQALAGREASFGELCEALHQAARLGRVAFVRALIAGGASVEAPAPPASWRPVHTAVEHGQIEAIRVLVASGADVNARAEEGMTPLHLAIDAATDSIEQVGSTDGLAVIRCLLELGADPRVQDDTGRTPRDWALEAGSDIVSEILA